MKRILLSGVFVWLGMVVLVNHSVLQAQQAGAGIAAAPGQTAAPNVISFSDSLANQPDGALTVTFALYPDQQSTTATWTETQVVQVSQNKYTALLGSTSADGIPASVFAADQAHWLGVQVNGSERRFLLVSVPYAMKAMEAERLGGLLPSDYVTTQQLQTILLNSSPSGSSAGSGKTAAPSTASGPIASASSNPPQPATDFTDNNASEVLLVTQQGTGFAIHAVSAGDAALFAENSTATGTALKAVATGTSGANIGILGQSASATGIAGVFDNTGSGQILSLRNNGTEVASVDSFGNFKVAQITAANFVGGGLGLTNVPNTATSATSAFVNNAIVSRDQNGGFIAGQITAANFVGSGLGLTNIPNSATTATPALVNNAIVSRDQNGGFIAGQITAANYVGSGLGLTNIPNSATTATPAYAPNAIVSRDQNGNFMAGQITAANYVGSGFGLTDIPNSATTATPSFSPNAIVSRDQNGNFTAGQVSALNFVGNGSGLVNIPAAAVGATSSNAPSTVVQRDQNGNIFASAVLANFFSGNGGGLSGIPNSATTATNNNTPNTIVARDVSGGFSAGFINVNNISADGIISSGLIDFSGASLGTEPVRAVLSANTPATCAASRELLIKTDATPGQQLFICNANGNGYLLVGDGISPGVTSVAAGDSSVNIGGTSAAPTIAVANGGITSAKLAPNAVSAANIANGSITGAQIALGSIFGGNIANGAIGSSQLSSNAVTAANIADGSLPPTKITGTVATLGANTFTGNQIVQGSLAAQSLGTGPLSATSALFSAGGTSDNQVSIKQSSTAVIAVTANDLNIRTAINASSGEGDAIDAQATYNAGVNATSTHGIAVVASGGDTGVSTSGTNFGMKSSGATALVGNGTNVGLAANASANGAVAVSMSTGNGGKFLSGTSNVNPNFSETFNVDTFGNILSAGALSAPFFNDPAGTNVSLLARLNADGGVQRAATTDTTGIVGVVMSLPGPTGFVQVAYSGIVNCNFDGPTVTGHYVVNSPTSGGFCSDAGSAYPSSGQVLGRILRSTSTFSSVPIQLFGPEMRGTAGSTLVSINTGPGLFGGPITTSGTIGIASGGVTNAMLQNSALAVNPGIGLSGGGNVLLGGTITLNNAGALSFNGRNGNIVAAPGDYSFNQLSGVALPAQLPATTVYNDQPNTFSANQTINAALIANSLAAGAIGGTSAVVEGSSNGSTPVVLIADASAAGNAAALSASSQNNLAANFYSSGPNILAAGTATHNVLAVTSSGMNVVGSVSATSFSGDGSALTNVNAGSLGGVPVSSLATASALNTESTARQSADTVLQANINTETAGRQSDVANLQTSINNVSAAGAKLASANAFTASNSFTGGTQDFSAAGATLPVRALPSVQTPGSCVAGKELLIKTDATAGQQLFICDGSGTTWNLVGDGAGGGVISFNGRNGSVSPSSGDYSFSQLSGSLASAQMPALSGDVSSGAGSTVTTLAPSGVTAGTYTKVTVDAKGRATGGTQAAFSDLAGSASQSQLPVNVVYNNQVNTFSANQTVNGNLSASLFTGNGGGLSNVNAATLNNLASSSFAQLGTNNTFNGSVTATSFSGNGSGLTSVNAATVNSLQMLKVTASISPASVAVQTCSEQAFAVSGINAGDTLLVVSQPSTHSPGTNIAIGGWRVSAANTVNIQFCNVGRNSASTPVAGTYTFALMR
jgi:hypothetical protein